MALIEIKATVDVPFEAVRTANKKMKAEIAQENRRRMTALVARAERLWEENIWRENERNAPSWARRDNRGLTAKLFGEVKALQAYEITGRTVGFGWPDTERLDRISRQEEHQSLVGWRAQEFGVDKIKMPIGVFVGKSGQLLKPQRGARTGIFMKFDDYKERRSTSGNNFPGPSSDKNKRRDARRVNQYKVPREPYVSGHKGKHFIRGAWEKETMGLTEEYQKIADKYWGSRSTYNPLG